MKILITLPLKLSSEDTMLRAVSEGIVDYAATKHKQDAQKARDQDLKDLHDEWHEVLKNSNFQILEP